MNHLKFVGGDVSPVRPNLTEHDRIDHDKSADFMKVFTDSESNISGEPQISKQKSLLVHPGQKVLGGNSK
jgi:hypothetical protein